MKVLAHAVFGGGDNSGVVELAGLHTAHSDADITAPHSLTREDGEWVQYSCGCDIRLPA